MKNDTPPRPPRRNRRTVRSSSLAAVAYDSISASLDIEFRRGAVYRYFFVPLAVYQALLSASSHGKYFNRQIRNTYPYLRLLPSHY